MGMILTFLGKPENASEIFSNNVMCEWINEYKCPTRPVTMSDHFGVSGIEADFMSRMLELDPSKRWTCKSLLSHPYLGDTSWEYDTSGIKEAIAQDCLSIDNVWLPSNP